MQIADQVRAADPRAAAFMGASLSQVGAATAARAPGPNEAPAVLTPSADSILMSMIAAPRAPTVGALLLSLQGRPMGPWRLSRPSAVMLGQHAPSTRIR